MPQVPPVESFHPRAKHRSDNPSFGERRFAWVKDLLNITKDPAEWLANICLVFLKRTGRSSVPKATARVIRKTLDNHMGQTIVEKILATHAGCAVVRPGEFISGGLVPYVRDRLAGERGPTAR